MISRRPPAAALHAHLAVPPLGGAPWPGVVVLHEGFGFNDDMHQHAERLATAGYLALAPDLYSGGNRWRCLLGAFRSLLRGQGPAFEDIERARRWIAQRSDCTGRVGVLGFCMGGGFALLAAPRGFHASAPNYPGLPHEPTSPALQGACPIVASYASRDPFARKGAAERLDALLDTLGVDHDVREYPGVRHSFLSRHDVGPLGVLVRIAGFGYDRAAAEDTWARILRFFDRHLRDRPSAGVGPAPRDPAGGHAAA